MATVKSYDDYIYDLKNSWDLDIYRAAYHNLMDSGGFVDTKIQAIENYPIDMDREITKLYNNGFISDSTYRQYLKKKDRYEHSWKYSSTLSAKDFQKLQKQLIKDGERRKINDLYNARYNQVLKRRQTEIAEKEAQDKIFGGGQATLSGSGTDTTVISSSTGVTMVNLAGGDPTPIGTRVTMSHTVVEENNSWVQKPDTGQDPNQLDRRPAWIDTNTEYHRTKTSSGLVVDSAIIKRYYSVIDAEIYFGNEYVEDVADISWQVIQNVQPLFGYNSYTYDEIARGNRLIHGSFIINFTNPNYLFAILEAANKANVTSITGMTDYSVPAYTTEGTNLSQGVKGRNTDRERGHHANMWPQTFDIDIIFGEKSGAGLPVHILLLGCAIQSCQQVLSASATGGPPVVMEQYSFIGQDIRTVVASAGHVAAETNLDNVSGSGNDSNNDSITSGSGSDTSVTSSSNNPSWADFQKLNDTNSSTASGGNNNNSSSNSSANSEKTSNKGSDNVQDDKNAQNRQQTQSIVLETIKKGAGLPSTTVLDNNVLSGSYKHTAELFVRAAGGTINGKTGLAPEEQKELYRHLQSHPDWYSLVDAKTYTYRFVFKTKEMAEQILTDKIVFTFTATQSNLLSKGQLSYE